MKPRMRIAFFSAVLIGSSGLFADVVHLKDGTKVSGSLKHVEDGWLVQQGDAKPVHVLSEQVDSIELTGDAAAAPRVAMDRLNSLRRSVDSLGDLNEIITRYQRFLDQVADAPSVTEAKKDMAIWQDRQKQKMTKVGTRWVGADERAKLVEQAGQNAELARQLMKQGRTKEAEPILTDVAAVDPSNAAAQYLIGLLRYQQEQTPAARKAFEATAAVVPNHAPTLNNLAIVLWRQRQFIAAMTNFDQAILASPVDKLLLDNVAVALQTTPPEFQKSPIALKLAKDFTVQDQQLTEIMLRQGMRRFGSLWVSDKDIERMKAEEKATQDKLDALASEFDRSRAKVDQLAQTITDNSTQMHRIEATSVAIDPRTGAQIPQPYPQAYYDLQRDSQNAGRQRDAEVARLDQMKKQAADLQNNRPMQKSQGVMRMVGPEGTPIRVVIAPASQPIR